ncbi:MAG: GDP-L-fucose synthase [Thermodesulfovibrionales bacterium]|nr:GDP-L-fucose synthase [Thermodesulfovibrionales bacterium]
MEYNSKIYVAGHRGLVGSAILRRLESEGYKNIIHRARKELDLTRQSAVEAFFEKEKPEYVFLAAAKVGGIHANSTYPAEFIYSNLMVQANVINAAHIYGVGKLLFLGSSCIYPRDCPQPMKEEYLLSGYLEPTNEPYAVAKIAGIRMCQSYNRQYGTNFISVMPTNLYGPNDNFDLMDSHVLPALIRKFHEAKVNDKPYVEVWGSGNPKREFLFVDDLADACLFLMENYDKKEIINIGTGEDVTVKELAETVKEVVGYGGEIRFDKTRPDGTPRKLLDVSRINSLGWKAKTPLREGIEKTYEWYKDLKFR